MKRRATAVLHLNGSGDANAVLNLARKVIAGYTANPEIFPNPDPPIADLQREADDLEEAITEAGTGNHQAVQDKDGQSATVHALLRNGTLYVSRIANGDIPTILLSGFDASDDPTPRAVPGRVPIQRIEDGPSGTSAKLFVETPGEPVDFVVQMLDGGPDPNAWVTVLETSNSRALVVEGLERAKEVHFRVAARSTKGQGPWSDPASFIPR